ncbi:MAG TPA: hypothetical protein VHK22_03380 [Gaiellaceae bacterium]|jgi:hypothetical protein|nr:hypothetical protein [Gaiellaceae bacterium]
MYSRVTLLEIDTMRINVGDAVELFEAEVLPRMRDEKGFEGVLALATPEGKGMLVSFWDTQEQAEDASGFATGELERFVALFRAPPGRECYQVVHRELPQAALS